MTRRDELTFSIWGEYANGINAIGPLFAARVLKDVHEALEHGRGFRSDCAERAVNDCLAQAERVKALLKARETA